MGPWACAWVASGILLTGLDAANIWTAYQWLGEQQPLLPTWALARCVLSLCVAGMSNFLTGSQAQPTSRGDPAHFFCWLACVLQT